VTPEKVFYENWEFWLTVFTFVLGAMTAWLALETRGLRKDSAESIHAARASVDIAKKQFEASVQPIVEVTIEPGYDFTNNDDGRPTYSKGAIIQLNNLGPGAFKIIRLNVLIHKHDEVDVVEVPEFRGQVITVAKKLRRDIIFRVRSAEGHTARLGVDLHCSDMAGITAHSYEWNPYDDSLHHIGPLGPLR